MVRMWTAALALLAAGAWCGSVQAQSIEVAWSAPEGCPSQAAVRARVLAMLARSDLSDATMRADGTVQRRGELFVLDLSLQQRGHSATRTLQDPNCASLAEAAAFLISVAIDPSLPPPPPPPPPLPAAEPAADAASTAPTPAPVDAATSKFAKEKPAAKEPAPPQASTPAPPAAADGGKPATDDDGPAAKPHVHAGLFGGMLFAGLAGPHTLLGVSAGLSWGRLDFALSGAYAFSRTKQLTGPRAESSFDAQELALTVCHLWGDTVRFGPCARASALRTHGEVSGTTIAKASSYWWATGSGLLALTYRLGSALELQLDGGPWLPLTARPRFEVQPLGSVGEAANVGGSLRLGANVQLP